MVTVLLLLSQIYLQRLHVYRTGIPFIARRNQSLCLPVRSLLQLPLPAPLPKSFLHDVKQHPCSCSQLAQSQGQASTTRYERMNPVLPQNELSVDSRFSHFPTSPQTKQSQHTCPNDEARCLETYPRSDYSGIATR
jgi:hypothetical protein